MGLSKRFKYFYFRVPILLWTVFPSAHRRGILFLAWLQACGRVRVRVRVSGTCAIFVSKLKDQFPLYMQKFLMIALLSYVLKGRFPTV